MRGNGWEAEKNRPSFIGIANTVFRRDSTPGTNRMDALWILYLARRNRSWRGEFLRGAGSGSDPLGEIRGRMHGGDLGRQAVGTGREHPVFANLEAHRGSLLQALPQEIIFHDAGAQD